MEKITAGNDFNLVIQAKRKTGTDTEDMSLVGIEDLQIYLTRAGRSKIAMSYALDVNGCAIINVDWNDVAVGVWGIEMKGKLEGADLRAHKINAFEIVGGSGTNGVLVDYVVDVVFAVNTAASDLFVEEKIKEHNEDTTAHPSLIEAIENAGKVDDVLVDGESIVDENKVAHINSDNFGKVDDVQVNGTSIVQEKIADIDVDVEVDAEVGVPSVDVTIEEGKIVFGFHNMKGETGDRGNGIESSTEVLSPYDGGTNSFAFVDTDGNEHVLHTKNGTKGSQGDSAVYDPSSPDAPDFVMANSTGDSTTKAMTQKAVTDAIDYVGDLCTNKTTIASSSLTQQNCSLGDSTWYLSTTTNAQRHAAIPVTPGMSIKVTHNGADEVGFYGFLTSSYSPPYSRNQSIPYVSGTSRVQIEIGSTVRISAPDGAAYLVLNTVGGGGTAIGYNVEIPVPLKDMISELGNRVDDVEKDTSLSLQLGTLVPLVNKYIGEDGIWKTSSSYRGRIIPIGDFQGKKITIVKNPNGTCRYAFLRSSSTSGSPAYCAGTSFVTVTAEDSPKTVTVPSDAFFLYLYAESNGTDVTPTIVVQNTLGNIVASKDFVATSEVDISDLTEQNCSLGVDVWYMANSQAQRHVAIEVSAGECYRISPSGHEGFYGLLTSSYSPPYVGNDTVPYAVGTNRNTIPDGDSAIVTIPTGCSYLVITTVDGAGISPTWTVEKGVGRKTYNMPFKFRLAFWNIGNFALGRAGDTTITHEQYPTMRQKWATAINDINADMFCMCEFNTNMVNEEGAEPAITARDAILSLYKYFYNGSQPSNSAYMHTAIMGNYEVHDVTEVKYPHTVVPSRYFQYGCMVIGGEPVYIVATHLDHNDHGEMAATYREEQMQLLIDTFADFHYVILCADWNVNSGTEFEKFTNAGYNVLNHGYLGDILTYPSGNEPLQPLDNIIVKGFNINGIRTVNDPTLTDHMCVYADLMMMRD